jgi:hypothetical protein
VVIKSRMMKYGGHIDTCQHNIILGKSEGKRQLERLGADERKYKMEIKIPPF